MTTRGILSLKRATLSASRPTRGASNAIHTERLLGPTKASVVSKRNIHPAQRQARSFTMAADTTTVTDSNPFEQLSYLRKVATASPFISVKAAPPEASEFQFPLATRFKAPNREVGLSMASMYAQAIREHGICAIEMGWPDPDSQFMLDVISKMGCNPDTHSSTQGALWDVKFKPEGVYSEGIGKKAVSISHSMGEFAWHTDAAFEENPTRFFGFHIIHPDKKGGGVFRILRADDLTRLLSPEAVGVLSNHEFELKVPPEFFKGKDSVKGKLLEVDTAMGRAYVRFRKDILHDPLSADANANAAVKELNDLLDAPEGVGEHVPGFVFKEDSVLLMDNARYLHSRTDIKDPKRWLRRVRFHGPP
ncbi:hypothetical protein IMSHALPRED_004761 [Imshaugia aleurites]|uniref:TauD/TfdA-like domain-containing protein n=1 Tax=Imshaugia aleurites TaxID=172621 RepID=A0A8H3IN93_9LECA|nr:hypothetical protein IMSHALPRED_004761 [Imshaugia aleurites]